MKKNYLISFLAVFIVHCILLILWLITTKINAIMFRTNVTFIETIIDILLPLGILVFLFIKKLKNKCFVLELIFSLAMGLFGTFFHYFNWGVSTKCFFHPDSETVWIFAALFEINLFSIIILGIIFQIILLIKNRKVKRI